ncbi:YhdH/YhfP family quinone oxidoreductase [Bordetella tumulicola]|uniref:YhdH/YhfP family quinone oxidoreductase n=1 Tax=Bordetella tumulicola TaxID=1649133 RepID=UPI0039F0AC60
MEHSDSLDRFDALVTRRTDGHTRSAIEPLDVSQLTAGEVVLKTRYAGVNYKDSLAITGRAKIITEFPRVAGIEAVGEVIRSDADGFAPGDGVLVHGFQTGIAYDGGFAERVRVSADHLQFVPNGLTQRQTAVLGVPGFTVAMALDRFEANGLRPDAGPIAVSGATGAVGMLAIAILAQAGYEVAAITRRMAQTEVLRKLGATEVIDAGQTLSTRPLESARFSAAIDNVGGQTLSWLLRSMKDGGQLASVGNASGNTYDGSVLPFIMRRVQMFGIVANASWPERRRLWGKLASDWKPDFAVVEPHVSMIPLVDLLPQAERQLSGQTTGRTIVAFGDRS